MTILPLSWPMAPQHHLHIFPTSVLMILLLWNRHVFQEQTETDTAGGSFKVPTSPTPYSVGSNWSFLWVTIWCLKIGYPKKNHLQFSMKTDILVLYMDDNISCFQRWVTKVGRTEAICLAAYKGLRGGCCRLGIGGFQPPKWPRIGGFFDEIYRTWLW